MSSTQRALENVSGNRRSYIATKNFKYDFYIYKGESLIRVTEDETLCPAGRVLRESGRRLYPGANPGINQYYVGVYDPVTFLKGFIDPNGGVFAEFNTNKPNYLDDNYSDDGDDDNSLGPDAGDPVYTKGNITAVGYNSTGNGNNNYIQLIDEASNSTAYLGFDTKDEPYVECRTDNNVGGDSTAGIYTHGTTAELYAYGGSNGEAQIELNANGFVGAYASDGSIYNSGVLHPYNTCGNLTLNTSGVATATVPAVSNPVVIVGRKVALGSNQGFLQWSITGTTLTITSTDSRDRSEVSWLLVSYDNND